MTITTRYNATAGRRVWTIYINGVAVWSQISMAALAEIGELISNERETA